MTKLKTLLQMAASTGALYQVRYKQYDESQFTEPVRLTDARIETLVTDKSVYEIKLIIKP